MDSDKIGVFICHCGSNIAGVIDIKRVLNEIARAPNVFVMDHTYLCSKEGLNELKRKIAEEKLSKVVIAACSPRLHERLFRRAAEEAGLNPFLVEFVNIREQCSWPHMYSPTAATNKAIALIKMGIEKARLLTPIQRRYARAKKRVLVIGGGVAGITAALSLASLGIEVYLVEKQPTLGGHMAMLDKLFPTLDCSICILAPLMSEVSEHPMIKVLTLSEVTSIKGRPGDFEVEILKRPRYVNEEKCVGCIEICSKTCPVEVPNEFDMGLRPRKAIYLPFPQAVPLLAVIDPDHCIGCRNCEDACERDAIDFNQTPERIRIHVGAIIVATGYETFDARLKSEYGYGRYPDVITSLELERLLSPSGPTRGRVVRLSNGKEPRRIVFIQCVGSRDESVGNPYCSRICCTASIKEAICIKERIPDAEVFILFQDIRTYGKGYEEFLLKAMRDFGIKIIRGRASSVTANENGDDLIVRAENTLTGEIMEINADLVVLSVGLVPPSDTEDLARMLGISQSSDGFLLERHPKLAPSETMIQGIYIAGTIQGPKDIQDTVAHSKSAALDAANFVLHEKIELDPYVPTYNPDLCKRCRLCEEACDWGALTFDKEKGVIINSSACLGCGACVAACPTGALDMPYFTNQQIIAQIHATLENKCEFPLIVAFLCNWCGYAAADFAGTTKIQYPTNIRPIRVMCTARVSPLMILEAFKAGADGVLVVGCHPQDCHYRTGFSKAERRISALKKYLENVGINPRRLKIASTSASEGERFANIVREFVEELKKLGPIGSELVMKSAG
ncbi:MAG: CoB-CoM heterodisulfide reductase HdrA2 [Candidatus Baldrarchaeia archaeon]